MEGAVSICICNCSRYNQWPTSVLCAATGMGTLRLFRLLHGYLYSSLFQVLYIVVYVVFFTVVYLLFYQCSTLILYSYTTNAIWSYHVTASLNKTLFSLLINVIFCVFYIYKYGISTADISDVTVSVFFIYMKLLCTHQWAKCVLVKLIMIFHEKQLTINIIFL